MPSLRLRSNVIPLTPTFEQLSGGFTKINSRVVAFEVCHHHAEVRLYHRDVPSYKVQLLQIVRSDEKGEYHFEQVPFPSEDQRHRGSQNYTVAVKAEGRASAIKYIPLRFAETVVINFSLRKSATLQGKVTGPDLEPIEGADVWIQGIGLGPLDGLFSCKTDAKGNFKISDLENWDANDSEIRDPTGRKSSITITARFFRVRHPEYGIRIGKFTKVPATVILALQPAAVIKGRVVFADSGKPASGVLVRALSLHDTNNIKYASGSGLIRTDDDGNYRFLLPESKYNLWTHHDDLTVRAIEGFEAKSGRTNKPPDLRLIKGGLIEGRLVNAISGEPLTLLQKDIVSLTISGPARPRSSGAVQVEYVKTDGSFRFRLPPGKNRLALPHSSYGSFKAQNDIKSDGQVAREIDVADGETVKVVFEVVRKPNVDETK